LKKRGWTERERGERERERFVPEGTGATGGEGGASSLYDGSFCLNLSFPRELREGRLRERSENE